MAQPSAADLAAYRNGPVVAPLERDVVVVAGPDAATYLHGQVSQGVTGLAVGAAAWTFVLEPQGRVAAWGRITRMDDLEFWFDTDVGHGERAAERLRRFMLRTDAEITERRVVMAAVRSGNTGSTVADASPSRADGLLAVPVPWPGIDGVDLVALASTEGSGASAGDIDLEALGLPIVGSEIVELARIEAGIPAMGAEIVERTIPAETGAVDRSADFTKGCYVGQELVARVDSRGNNTPRSVLPIRSATGVPEAGTPIVISGDEVGVVTSVAGLGGGSVGLASIARGTEPPAEADAAGTPIEILPRPT